eukprot:jgi/Botrbrau1/16489/Bobra.0142s0083.1
MPQARSLAHFVPSLDLGARQGIHGSLPALRTLYRASVPSKLSTSSTGHPPGTFSTAAPQRRMAGITPAASRCGASRAEIARCLSDHAQYPRQKTVIEQVPPHQRIGGSHRGGAGHGDPAKRLRVC